jgi:hypothetical protein
MFHVSYVIVKDCTNVASDPKTFMIMFLMYYGNMWYGLE